MSEFRLTRTVLRTIREHAGKTPIGDLAALLGCSVPSLQSICTRNGISLRYDKDEAMEAAAAAAIKAAAKVDD